MKKEEERVKGEVKEEERRDRREVWKAREGRLGGGERRARGSCEGKREERREEDQGRGAEEMRGEDQVRGGKRGGEEREAITGRKEKKTIFFLVKAHNGFRKKSSFPKNISSKTKKKRKNKAFKNYSKQRKTKKKKIITAVNEKVNNETHT